MRSAGSGCLAAALVALGGCGGAGGPGLTSDVPQVCFLLPAEADAGASPVAIDQLRGATLGFELLGGLGARPPAWIGESANSATDGAVGAYLRCHGAGAHVVVGPFEPGSAPAVAEVASEHDGVLVVPRVAGPGDASGWGRNVFAVAPPPGDVVRVAARWLGSAGSPIVTVLHGPAHASAGLTEVFAAEGAGIGEVRVVAVAPAAPAWADAAAASTGDLFVLGTAEQARLVVEAMSSAPLAGRRVLLADSALSPSLVASLPSDVEERLFGVVPRMTEARWLSEHYAARWEGAALTPAAAAGYEAVRLALDLAPTVASRGWRAATAQLPRRTLLGTPFGTTSFVREQDVVYEAAAGYAVSGVVRQGGDVRFEPVSPRSNRGPENSTAAPSRGSP